MTLISRRNAGIYIAAAMTALMTPTLIHADSGYPTRLISLVVPFPPGGAADVAAREIAEGLRTKLNVPVIVENKGGGATIPATRFVIDSKSDGYTLFLGSTPTAINESLRSDMPYEAERDLRSISDIGHQPLVLVVNTDSKYNNLQDIIDAAKKKPGSLSYASQGVGGSPHLATELLLHFADIDALHVPYKGSAATVTGLIGGQVDFVFESLMMTLPFIKDGRLRAIAQTGGSRSELLPDVPTIKELGHPEYEATSWFSLMTGKNVPDSIVNKLNEAVVDILSGSEELKKFVDRGLTIESSTPEQADARFSANIKFWKKAVEVSGATAE